MRPVFLLVVMLFAPAIWPAQPEGAELHAKLDARVTQYSVSATGLADAFARTSKQFQLPIGIEWVKDAEVLRSLNHTWKDKTDIVSPRDLPPGAGEGGIVHEWERHGNAAHTHPARYNP